MDEKKINIMREHLDSLIDRDEYNDGIHRLSDDFYKITDIQGLNLRFCTDSWMLS